MNNNLQIFKNNEFGEIRVVTKDNEPWFVGKDISEKLGYKDTSDSLKRHVDDEDKGVGEIPTPGGKQNMKIINESGLYSLILSSKLPTAKKFKKWVTSEILPSIRKHGAYMTEQTLEEVLSNPDTLIRLATDLKKEREERQKLQLESKQKDKEIESLKPLATYTERILQSTGLFTTSQIAKDYGIGVKEFNKLLNTLKVQYKQNGQWLLYAKFQGEGYTMSETIPITHSDGRPDAKMSTKWTQKGRLFLYNYLKVRGIVPTIEQQYKDQISMIN